MMAGGATPPPVAFVVLFPCFFAGLWLAINYLLSRFSGWTVLQDVYPDRDDIVQARFRMQSASMGGAFGMPVNYNGCLTVDACSNGVRFRVWPIFGLFQRPVFVPWRDISVDTKRVLFFTMARLRFAHWHGGEMTMRVASWNRLARQSPVPGLALSS